MSLFIRYSKLYMYLLRRGQCRNLTYCHRWGIKQNRRILLKGDNSIRSCSWSFQNLIPKSISVDVSCESDLDKGRENSNKQSHIPVMVKEVLDRLDPNNGKLYIDMTFGAGGHTKAILNEAPQARVVCLDRDPIAHQMAVSLSQQYSPGQIIPCLGQFSELSNLLEQHSIQANMVDGVLFDVGPSSMQFNTADRGFSISKDGPLDMRMDSQRLKNQPTAADVVNKLDEVDLYNVIKKFGGEREARKIAHAIIQARYAFGDITWTSQLAEIVASVFPEGAHRRDRMNRHAHVATKTFQALRIFVNNELNELNNGLETAYHYLSPGGVCVVLSFHSLEDRIVKRHFHGIDLDEKPNMSSKDHIRQNRNSATLYDTEIVQEVIANRWSPLSRKVVTTTMDEIYKNPRSRSAKLRAAIKL